MDKLNMENSCDTKQKIMDGGANDANEIISRAKFKYPKFQGVVCNLPKKKKERVSK